MDLGLGWIWGGSGQAVVVGGGGGELHGKGTPCCICCLIYMLWRSRAYMFCVSVGTWVGAKSVSV